MNSIKLAVGVKERIFDIDPHFNVRMKQRAQIRDIASSMLNAIYIAKRPNHLQMLLKHGCLASFYLLDTINNIIYVIEENTKTREISIVKTLYDSRECQWIQNWMSQNPRDVRKRFREVFCDDSVFKS